MTRVDLRAESRTRELQNMRARYQHFTHPWYYIGPTESTLNMTRHHIEATPPPPPRILNIIQPCRSLKIRASPTPLRYTYARKLLLFCSQYSVLLRIIARDYASGLVAGLWSRVGRNF
jgi:hypothetical protein